MSGIKVVVIAALACAASSPCTFAQTNLFPKDFQPGKRFPARPGKLFASSESDTAHRIDIRLPTFDLTTNFVVAEVETGPEIPAQIALLVRPSGSSSGSSPSLSLTPEVATNADKAIAMANALMERFKAQSAEEQLDWQQLTWIPFTSKLPIDLGSGEGERLVWIAAEWKSEQGSFRRASATHLNVYYTAPLVVITNPVERVTSRPMIQLQGYSDRPLSSIRYDVINASNSVADQQGFVTDQALDPLTAKFTTNYFTCTDIELSLGTNTIILRCQDFAGKIATNVWKSFYTLEFDHTPPVIQLEWPLNGAAISGDSFTARGRLDDPTARMTALISAAGQTNAVEGLVERNGYFWVENIPLANGTNLLALTATDAAGNAAYTNAVISRSDDILTMDPVIPADKLWKPYLDLTGKVRPATHRVWVNGVEAHVNPDGSWFATKVPVLSPNGGTAVFEIHAEPYTTSSSGASSRNEPAPPKGLLSISAGLGTNAMTLNASRPACGSFELHLTGVSGRSFVLLASTNLTEWTPVLTNLNSKDTFDFTDSNASEYRCRFFRVMPVP